MLSAYLPQDRRRALTRNEALPEQTQGTALFADISGFTPLTEALTRELGPQRGAEELTQYLDQVYNALIQEVDRFGGSVIGFSGDAITCWFESGEAATAVQLSALSATACASAMQQNMKGFEAIRLKSGETVALAVKVAIASGAARRFLVGDPNIQLWEVITGSTLAHLAETEQMANKGEILLNATTVEHIADAIEIAEWRTEKDSRCAVLKKIKTAITPPSINALDTLTPEQARLWILPSIYERERSGQGKFLAELRQATALFLRFEGIDYDHDPDAQGKLDAYIRWVQGVVEHYEGLLVQLTFGDKGSYLYIAFGAPIAHDDDVVRAVRTAHKLQRLPPNLTYIQPPQMGIAAGRMRVGPYGSRTRRTYGVLGDEVNLAARLMQVAKAGEVIVTAPIATRAHAGFKLEMLSPIKVKGKSQLITIYRLMGISGHTGTLKLPQVTSELVGRLKERQLLQSQLEKLKQHTSSVSVIEGEPGIGKSRVVEDVIKQAEAQGITALVGAADAMERSTPYYAWRAIFQSLFQWESLSADTTERQAQILSRLPPHLRERAPLLNAVLPLEMEDNELTAPMTRQIRADNTREMLTALLQLQSEQHPILIILEDAHWLDSASWALAVIVQQRVQPLWLIIATRSLGENPPMEYTRLMGLADAQHLKLEALEKDDILSLVAKRLGVSELPKPLIELINTKAEGNPFFSEELAYALRDSKIITIENGKCQIAAGVDFEKVTLPNTVEGVVTSRIDRLTAAQQLTLKVASVIGRVFAFRTLRDVHPLPEDVPLLNDHLQALARIDLTPLETPEPDLAYLFKHIITQEVSYNLMLFAQRRDLHRVVAQWYEERYHAELAPHYALLAYHWSRAEDDLKALEYYEQAGEAALRGYANKEAVTFFNAALQIAEKIKDLKIVSHLRRGNLLAGLGLAYRGLGDTSKCRQHLEMAVQVLDQPIPQTRLGYLVHVSSQIAQQVAHRALPPRVFRRTSPEAQTTALQLTRLYCELTIIYMFTNEVLSVLYTALRAINLAEEVAPSSELLSAYGTLVLAAGLSGRHRLADMYYHQAMKVRQTVKVSPIAVAEFLVGVYHYRSDLGQWDEARAAAEEAQAIFEQFGVRAKVGACISQLGQSHLALGHLDQAQQLGQELLTSATRADNLLNQVYAYVLLSVIAMRVGQHDESLRYWEKTLELCKRQPQLSPALAVGNLALVHWRERRLQQAKQAADESLQLNLKKPQTIYAAYTGYAGTAEVYMGLWAEAIAEKNLIQAQQLRSLAKQACQILRKFSNRIPVGRPSAWLCDGYYAWLEGDPQRALSAWENSLAAAQKYHMPYEEGKAHFYIGRAMKNDEHLRAALEIFERVGATYDVEQVKAVSSEQ